MNLPTNAVLAEHASALRENSLQCALLRNAFLSGGPQWLDDRTLRARYCMDDNKQLRAQLEKHRITSLPKGRGFKVHIDDVLRLDDLIKGQRVTA